MSVICLMVRLSIFLFCIIAMASTNPVENAPAEMCSGNATALDLMCRTIPNSGSCPIGTCQGGCCAPCQGAPNICCVVQTGVCIYCGQIYGYCTPTCTCCGN